MELMQSNPRSERVVTGAVGAGSRGEVEVMGRFVSRIGMQKDFAKGMKVAVVR